MRNAILMISVLGVVAGCSPSNTRLRSYDAEWWGTKNQCTNGDFQACAEIGHAARGPVGATPQGAPQPYQISTPIID